MTLTGGATVDHERPAPIFRRTDRWRNDLVQCIVVADGMGEKGAIKMGVKTGGTKREPAKSGTGGARGAAPLIGIAAGAAVGSAAIAAALIFAGRLRNPFVDAEPRQGGRRSRSDRASSAPAAFASDTPTPAGAVHVRDAGPDNVRDRETGRVWDRVDEASDQSFPASDPPSH